MDKNRFKMSFGNNLNMKSNTPSKNMLVQPVLNLNAVNQPVGIRPANNYTEVKGKDIKLNSSMIDRVHKAKPGCSACGKKVA